MFKKLKQAAQKLYEWWKKLGKPSPVWLLVLLGCAPVSAGVGVAPQGSSLRALPPGQVARAQAVTLERRVAVREQPDTMVVRVQWSVAGSIDSVRVVVQGYGTEEVLYWRGAGGLATSHEARFLLPQDAATVAGYAWACVITYRGGVSGGTVYGPQESPEQHTARGNCSPWTPYAWEFSAPLASGVSVTVERRP